MRILVTGVTGFVGSHLADVLVARGGVEVFGVSRQAEWPLGANHLAQQVEMNVLDLCDGPEIEAVLRRVRPERIFHLAGYPHVGQSVKEPEAAWTGNLQATRSLYDAILRWGGKPRILFVGSGLIYGDPETLGQAFNERSPLRPTTPYGVSKASADLVSFQYTRTGRLEIVRARPFNHIGPRQAPDFAVAHFARQIAAIAMGKQPPLLETGNLSPRRDLTDVRDVAHAYLLLMEKGRSGEAYNVGAGKSSSMLEIVEHLLALAKVSAEIRQRPDLMRANEVNEVLADANKLRTETGWAPSFPLDRSLADTLEYWRSLADRPAQVIAAHSDEEKGLP